MTIAKIYIEEDMLYLDLPYSQTGFDAVEQFTTSAISKKMFSHGESSNTNVYYDYERKQWAFNLTEQNILFIKDFLADANILKVNYSAEVKDYLNSIEQIQKNKQDFNVELCVKGGELTPYIKNASQSLLDHIEKENIVDLWELIDKSHELGYGLSDKIKLMLGDSVEHTMVANSRVSLVGSVKDKEKKLKQIVLYALKYNRFPIIFYIPKKEKTTPALDKKLGQIVDTSFDTMAFKVIKQFIKDDAVGVAKRNPLRKDCLVYHAHNLQDLIESEIHPQLIFFSRLINEKTFNIFLDQIPKVCYYNTIELAAGEEHWTDKRLLKMLGPGQEYYAKV